MNRKTGTKENRHKESPCPVSPEAKEGAGAAFMLYLRGLVQALSN
jgi:hypothetical protein